MNGINTSWVGSVNDRPERNGRRRAGEAITRVCTTAPEWAELALEAIGRSQGHPGGGFRLAVPGASLQLRSVTGDDTGTRFAGVLTSDRGWHRLDVEVELVEWSRGESELTLRLRNGTRRPGWGGWYLRTGLALMDLLEAAVQARVALPSQPVMAGLGTSDRALASRTPDIP